MVKMKGMPTHSRVIGNGTDSHAAGRGRQRIKLAAIGYAHARHGVDADETLARAALTNLCKMAIEYVEAAIPGSTKNRRMDRPGNSDMLRLAAIAYTNARHGMDAERGIINEGLAILCQAAIEYVEALSRDEAAAKRTTSPSFQIGHGG
jgi:hypothetical protein